jgi:RNA polymerase sigma factor (sigma-70 family)
VGAHAEPGSALPFEALSALEDRHRSLTFAEARRAVIEDREDGWRIFVEKYSRFVYTVALRLLTDPPQQREERAQQIYCSVFERLQRDDYRILREFQGRCRFTTYLFRMVQTARSSVLRRVQRERERIDYVDFADEMNRGLLAAAKAEDPDRDAPALSPEKLRGATERLLADLSPRERLLVRLRFQKGLKLRELAEVLSLRDTNAAAYALRKALERFEPLAALGGGGWSGPEEKLVLAVLDRHLFQ